MIESIVLDTLPAAAKGRKAGKRMMRPLLAGIGPAKLPVAGPIVGSGASGLSGVVPRPKSWSVAVPTASWPDPTRGMIGLGTSGDWSELGPDLMLLTLKAVTA